jgi:hypothetical protein
MSWKNGTRRFVKKCVLQVPCKKSIQRSEKISNDRLCAGQRIMKHHFLMEENWTAFALTGSLGWVVKILSSEGNKTFRTMTM